MSDISKLEYLIRLDSYPPSWVDSSLGDPGRTTQRDEALRFPTLAAAEKAMQRLQEYYPRRMNIEVDG